MRRSRTVYPIRVIACDFLSSPYKRIFFGRCCTLTDSFQRELTSGHAGWNYRENFVDKPRIDFRYSAFSDASPWSHCSKTISCRLSIVICNTLAAVRSGRIHDACLDPASA